MIFKFSRAITLNFIMNIIFAIKKQKYSSYICILNGNNNLFIQMQELNIKQDNISAEVQNNQVKQFNFVNY